MFLQKLLDLLILGITQNEITGSGQFLNLLWMPGPNNSRHNTWIVQSSANSHYPGRNLVILANLCEQFGQLQFITLIAACFVLARRDAADPGKRGRVWYSVVTGLLVIISDAGFVLTVKLLDGSLAGLISRLGIFVGWSWIVLLAIRLLQRKS